MKPRIRSGIVSLAIFAVLAMLIVPTASAWWWSESDPPGGHALPEGFEPGGGWVDADATIYVTDDELDLWNCGYNTGGPTEQNPEYINDTNDPKWIWSCYYELSATYADDEETPPDLTFVGVAVTAKLYAAPTGGAWTPIPYDEDIVSATVFAQQGGLTDAEDGYIHLFNKGFNIISGTKIMVEFDAWVQWAWYPPYSTTYFTVPMMPYTIYYEFV